MTDKMPFENFTDEQLVLAVLKNSNDYIYLMKRYERKLERYIRNIAGLSNADIEDVLQEVFIQAYRNLRDFDTSLKFSSWIYRIAHNKAIDHYRRAKVRPATLSIQENDGEFLKNIASDFNLSGEMDRKYLADKVKKVLGGMDTKYREVLVLKYLEGRDYREISDILEKPQGTVSALMNRAKQKFKQEAAKRNFIFS